MERCDCILLALLHRLRPLHARCLDISLGVLGTSQYHGAAVAFCSVDIRCCLQADTSAISEMLEELIALLQTDEVLLAFTREKLTAELKVIALPADGPAFYYDTTALQCETVHIADPATTPRLALQLIIPTVSSTLQQELELLQVFAWLNRGRIFALLLNSVEIEDFAVCSNCSSFAKTTGERLLCFYEEAEALSDSLSVVLAVGFDGVPVATSDPLFDLVRSRLLLESKAVFSKPAKSVEKTDYREKLLAASVTACANCFYIVLDLSQATGLNEAIQWAFGNVRAVLMAEVLTETDLDEFFVQSFSQSAASLISQIYARGGRPELDTLFPEPMDAQGMSEAILREALTLL